MMEKVLDIDQVFATKEPVQYVCFGLGSCIGLFVTDRLKGLSAGAHIPMPTGEGGKLRSASEMIASLLMQLKSLGSSLNGLRAKLTGGAQMFEGSLDIGAKNAEAVLKHLTDQKIYIAAKDVGGSISRTARFSSSTGELKISTSEKKEYII